MFDIEPIAGKNIFHTNFEQANNVSLKIAVAVVKKLGSIAVSYAINREYARGL